MEFLFVIVDYLSTLNKRIAFYEWGTPLIIGTTGFMTRVS